MNQVTRHPLLAALLLAGFMVRPAAAAAAPDGPRWEVLVPAGDFGRFTLRVERAELAGTIGQVASRLANAWADDPWPMLGETGATGPVLSRLTPAGIEAIELGLAPSGRIEARRSVLRWRDAASGPSVGAPGASDTEPAFIAALGGIGEPLATFASRDGDTANLTRAWLAPGDVPTASRQVERAAVRHGLSTLLRFDAPPDAPASLRGGRVLAFAGQGAAVVVTLNPHAAGAAVVVHFQERRP